MWNNIERIDSSEGNVCKFVYTSDNAVAESVLYRYPTYEERTVICCSTQSGCPVGCRFCGAGDYFVRSLSSEEIVDQVKHSLSETGVDPNSIDRLQIMFMSMGEPLLNFKNLSKAIKELHSLYPKAALLISTIGPHINYDPVIELSKEVPTVGLQFSIHKSTDDERNKLIPFEHKLSLHEIAVIGEKWYKATGRQPFFNYCAGDDNSTDADAYRLLELFDPAVWQCTISVICERNEGLPARNDHQVNLASGFSQKMLNLGFSVRVFDPAGQDDIGGGCGQLWFVQRWMQENPDKARPSVGNSLPVVHTPCNGCSLGG
jgi:23S rRNA (adenine2503-C2)-methyltransferase